MVRRDVFDDVTSPQEAAFGFVEMKPTITKLRATPRSMSCTLLKPGMEIRGKRLGRSMYRHVKAIKSIDADSISQLRSRTPNVCTLE
eukprot:scaffold5198_cov188-Prasinococcus_capsulatus_cf.AAC.3